MFALTENALIFIALSDGIHHQMASTHRSITCVHIQFLVCLFVLSGDMDLGKTLK